MRVLKPLTVLMSAPPPFFDVAELSAVVHNSWKVEEITADLVVKRMEIDDNELVIISDNPAYPQLHIAFAQIEIRVIIHGVVFWSTGALETHR